MRGIVTLLSALLLTAPIGSTAELTKINIGLASSSIPGGSPRIAKEMGLFEKHGLDARIVPMDNASVATMGLISGSLEFTTTAGSEVVIAQSRGQDIVTLRPVYQGFAAVLVLAKSVADKLAVKADAPASERLKALDGLTIASPSANSSYTLALNPAVKAAGAKASVTYIAMEAMPAALESGAVQGFIASSPFYGQAVLSGRGVIWLSGPKGDFVKEFTPANASVLNVMRSYADAHPDTMAKINSVFDDFAAQVKSNPQAVTDAIQRLFPSIDRKTLDLIFTTEGSGFSTQPLTADDLTKEIEFVKKSSTSLPNLDQLNPTKMMWVTK